MYRSSAISVLAAFVLAGCNGGSGKSTGSPNLPSTTTPPSTTPPTTAPPTSSTGTATRLVVTPPPSSSANIGAAPLVFVAKGENASGNTVPLPGPVTWSATGGSIDAATGAWSPYDKPGTYTITAKSGTLSGTATAQILPVAAETGSIYGIFDTNPGAAQILRANGNSGGYLVDTLSVKVFKDTARAIGWDQTGYATLGTGITIIARLNWDYNPNGTIPPVGQPGDPFADYAAYAQEMATLAKRVNATLFVIGNEPNLAGEWPTRGGVADPITVAKYVDCYKACYAAIKAARPDAVIMPAPVGLWDAGTPASGVPDSLDYWQQEITQLQTANVIDAICMHVFTHGYNNAATGITTNFATDPTQTTINGKQMNWHFQVYTNLIGAMPTGAVRALPIYVTECNGLLAADTSSPPRVWPKRREAWIQNIYAFVSSWNSQPSTQTIRTVCMFRFEEAIYGGRQYGLGTSAEALEDLKASVGLHYHWK